MQPTVCECRHAFDLLAPRHLIHNQVEVLSVGLVSITPQIDQVLATTAGVGGREFGPGTRGHIIELVLESRCRDVAVVAIETDVFACGAYKGGGRAIVLGRHTSSPAGGRSARQVCSCMCVSVCTGVRVGCKCLCVSMCLRLRLTVPLGGAPE